MLIQASLAWKTEGWEPFTIDSPQICGISCTCLAQKCNLSHSILALPTWNMAIQKYVRKDNLFQ